MSRTPGALLAALSALAIAIALGASTLPASAKPDPKPPKPKIELLTTNEEGALAKRAIKIRVSAKRGAEVVASANVVVEGFPEDFPFGLGPQRKSLKKDKSAKIRFPLNARKIELIQYAADTCRATDVTVEAEVKKRTGRLRGSLALPSDC